MEKRDFRREPRFVNIPMNIPTGSSFRKLERNSFTAGFTVEVMRVPMSPSTFAICAADPLAKF